MLPYQMAAMTPLGVPIEQEAAQSGRKPVDDVMEMID